MKCAALCKRFDRARIQRLATDIDTRTQIIEALGRDSDAHAVARQIGDVSHVSVWQIAKDERIELAAGKGIKGKPGIAPEMRARIIEALRRSAASPRLIARQLGNTSHVTVWRISKEVADSKRPQGGPPTRVRKCATVRVARAPKKAGHKT
jgi:hypothetical protein